MVKLKVFSVRFVDGKDVAVLVEGYEQNEGQYVFRCARILNYAPRRYRGQADKPSIILPEPGDVITFLLSQVAEVKEAVPPPAVAEPFLAACRT